MAPLSSMVVGIASALPEVVAAFRTGAGVPYEAYGPDIRRGIADVNRPGFEHLLTDWLAALPDVRERLDGPGARIADLGCGTGASTLALATACPGAQVDGIDLDAASVEEAAELAAAAGLADRVRMHHADAAESRFAGEYQLVTLFETLHDMARPVEALAAARGMLTEGGAVLVGDEKVAETFTAPGDELERFNYGWSALHCLAAAMGEPGTEATGTAMRADRVAAYATRAGFSRCTVLDIEHDFWRFYRLDP
jgi:2-polyprenyl-3-methyl-5-hydroxy-6-metoxy-1,4-benzoquinol methylase